jgi:hypothetical protein
MKKVKTQPFTYFHVTIVVLLCTTALLAWYWLYCRGPDHDTHYILKVKNKMFDNSNDYLRFEQGDIDYYNELPQTDFLYQENEITFEPHVNEDTRRHDTATHDTTVLNNIHDDNLQPTHPIQVNILNVDTQNVHDTLVNKYTKNIFSELRSSSSDPNLIENILKEAPEKDLGVITKVLNKIKDRNSNITNLGSNNELEILDRVWQHSKTNENIRNELFNQIKDSYENGYTVCPTGFVNRIVSCIHVESPEKMAKTKDIVKQEMLNTASFIMNQIQDLNLPHAVFRSKLMEKLEKDYSGIMTSDEIADFIKEWIDYI